MVHTDKKERELFAARLKIALDNLPNAPSGYGRAAWLSRHLPFSITPKGVGKWLKGDAMPTRENMPLLSTFLSLNSAWLSHGEGSMTSMAGGENFPQELLEFLRIYREASPEDQQFLEQTFRFVDKKNSLE